MSVTDVGEGDKRIFLRKASGLIRTASETDTFIYDLGLVSIGLGVTSMLFYGPAFYPQGDLIWGSIIAGVAMAMIAFGFITWSITLPRSGGIYVFGSRILPPALALTLSLVEITAWLFYCAIAAYWIVTLALAPMFSALSLLTGNEAFLAISKTMLEPWVTFLIGAAILVLSHVVISYGMRFYLTVNKWVFIFAMASTIILIVTLALGSREQFVNNFNTLLGPSLGTDAYNAVIASGKEKGWGEAGFDWWQTILVSNWPFLPLIGAAFSIAIGGEIKSVRRSQTIGMLGAVFVATVAFVVTVWLAYRVFGFEFMGTASFNSLMGEGGLTTPTEP
jgi:amino acid transporter